MNIYIPAHLKKIPLVKQMCDMIVEYANYYEDSSSSFDDYRYYQKLDPVKRFLGLCIPDTYTINGITYEYSEEEYEIKLNYLSRLFYSVKGTVKVLDYMKRYLDSLNILGDIIYTIDTIEIEFGDLSLDDEELFYQCFEDFLSELLYYGELKISSNAVKLKITSKITTHLGGSSIAYLAFTPGNYNSYTEIE